MVDVEELKSAEDCFNQGDFASARETYERILRDAGEPPGPLRDICKFNIASCLASEGNLVEALNQLLDIDTLAKDDLEKAYNNALCLKKLGRPDLALAVINSIGAIGHRGDESSVSHNIIRLLIDCLDNLCRQAPLSRGQAIMVEQLLLNHKTQITAHIGEDSWNRNMAHALFLIDCRFGESAQLYEALLNNEHGEPRDNILDTDSDVLANLCASYILTGRNRDAEELIKEVEETERVELHLDEDPERLGCLTHINLAISTLYCVKGNHEFGLARLIKGLEPIDKKLTALSWQQASRCLLSTLDKHCKQMICIRDDLFDQIVSFLIQCETYGRGTRARPITVDGCSKKSVASQARLLRSIVLALIHD